MISALFDHLWQSTLVALAAGALAMAFGKARAQVRYGLWFAASAKFLIPFAALAALGRLVAPVARPPALAAPEAALIRQAAQPFSQTPAAVDPVIQAAAPIVHSAPPVLDPTLILFVVWALGSALLLVVWLTRWARVRRIVREAARLALPAPMPVLASPSMMEPGLVGLWRPVLVVPETLFDHLPRPAIEALVAHEACHLRRRDNLTAAIHMLVEALFWFHPLVWRIGSRLIEERERACDEAVVRSGHDRAAYARSLLECCRLYLQSPLPCAAGASGSDLKSRVQAIMTAPIRASLSRPRKAVLAAAAITAVATPVTAGWLTSPTLRQDAARVAAIASQAAEAALQDARGAVAGPRAAKIMVMARAEPPPLQAASVSATANAGAETIKAEAPPVSLEPLAQVEVAQATLIPVSDRISAADAHVITAADITAAPPSITAPVWVRLPTLRDIIETSPNAADRIEMPGSATMRCQSSSRGYLSRCVVISESAPGLGFGQAAIFLQDRFKLRTLDGDNIPVQGRQVEVTIEFTPRYWARIVGEGGVRSPSGAPQVVRWVTDPLTVPYGRARYPWEALQAGLAAQVWLHCKVQPDGRLGDCVVGRETPRGLGFGQMALLSKPHLLRVQTQALDGSPMAGRTVEVRYVFNPPCYAKADSNQPPCPAGTAR